MSTTCWKGREMSMGEWGWGPSKEGEGGERGREGKPAGMSLLPKVAGCFALCEDWGLFRLSFF